MKKVILVGLIILLGFSLAYAVPPVMVTNSDGSKEVVVSSTGQLTTTKKSRATLSRVGTGQLYVGSCAIQSINFWSSVAGDSGGVYDITTITTGPVTTAELEFEIGISANNSSVPVPANGSPIVRGIYVCSSSNAITTVVIDY